MKAKDWFLFGLVWIFLFQVVLGVIIPGWPPIWPWFVIIGGLSIWLIGDQYPTFFPVLTALFVVLIHLVRKTFRRYPMFNTSMAMFVIAMALLGLAGFVDAGNAIKVVWMAVGFVCMGLVFLLLHLSSTRHRQPPPWDRVRSRFAREELDHRGHR